MSDATSPLDAMAARIATLEALARAVAEHAVAHAQLDEVAAERDRAVRERNALREAYELLQQQTELARRRLVIAKAERIDTTQLELEFAGQLAEAAKAARAALEAEEAAAAATGENAPPAPGGGDGRGKMRFKASTAC